MSGELAAACMRRCDGGGCSLIAGKDNKSKAAAAAATALSLVRCTVHSGFSVVGTWQNCSKC